MNKYVNYGLSAVLLVVIAGTTVRVMAAAPAPAAPGSSFDQRLAQRKNEQAITLSAVDITRLNSTCGGAQDSFRKMQVTLVPQIAQRVKVYQNIDAKILVVIGELKLANKDTFQLEKQRLELVGDTSNFQTTSSNFTQAIDDALVINCKADPTGFKSLVETVRSYNDDLRTQAAAERDLIVNKIKPELSSQSDSLQTKAATSKDGN